MLYRLGRLSTYPSTQNSSLAAMRLKFLLINCFLNAMDPRIRLCEMADSSVPKYQNLHKTLCLSRVATYYFRHMSILRAF